MHEISLMEGILDTASSVLKSYSVKRVNSLTVQIGLLANIIPSAFEFAFEVLSTETSFAGAELIVEKLPLHAKCSQCGEDFKSTTIPFCCPVCSNKTIAIQDGTEVYLASIDFDEKEKVNEN